VPGAGVAANFDCSKFREGDTDASAAQHARELIRWDSTAFNGLAVPIVLPNGMGLKPALQFPAQTSSSSSSSSSSYQRFMLRVTYDLKEDPLLIQRGLWMARRPWSESGLTLKLRHESFFTGPQAKQTAGLLSISRLHFQVPPSVASLELGLNVSLRDANDPRSARGGIARPLHVFGYIATTRDLGVQMELRFRAANASSGAKPRAVWRQSKGRGMRLFPSKAQHVPVYAGDELEVVCTYSSLAMQTARASTVPSPRGGGRGKAELCGVQLLYYPRDAVTDEYIEATTGHCTSTSAT